MSLFAARQLDHLADVVEDAARRQIRPRFRRLAAADIRTKTGPLDLVTDADEAAERVITQALQREYPGCLVVGEEAASADPAILAGLMQADLAFVIDPVDGTSNFAWGLPLFASMAAVLIRGEVVAAVIHDPLGEESAMALRGAGAFNRRCDGRRVDLRVAAPVPVAEMAGGVSFRFLPDGQGPHVAARLTRVAASFNYRCAGHEYRLLAQGHCHYLFYGRLYPWDHAPGWLLHQEAGGYAAHFDGTPYNPGHLNGGLILTPDQHSWQALHAALLGP